MKVLHVIPAVAAQYGGPSQAIFEMCRALQEQGVEPLIATTDADGAGRLQVELGRPTTYKGMKVIFFARQWSEAFKYSYPLARWLDQNVANFDAVHIHSVFPHACLAAARACRRRGVPYVVRPLGTLDPWSLGQKPIRKKLLWYAAAKQMLKAAYAVHYTMPEERRLAERTLGLSRGIVIPLGVDREQLQSPGASAGLSEFYPSLGQDPYVLVLCRLHPKKGLELLLQAFTALVRRKEFKRWRLVVAGDGEPRYVAALQRLVHQNGGSDHILLTGWLEGARKISALRGASLLALPSYQENFGISVMESMSCGVPVLVSPHVNLAEQIQAAGAGWVVGLEKATFEQTLAHILGDGEERQCRGEAAKRLASAFSWPQIAASLVKLYQSVTKSGRLPEESPPEVSQFPWIEEKAGAAEESALPSENRVPLSVVVLTYNEEANLPGCLESLKGLDCELFVVDSGSTDRTVEIAKAAGAVVRVRPFDNYAVQRNWAQQNLPIRTEWVLHLDADERLTPELVREINGVLQRPPPNIEGFLLRKRTIFMGRWIKHGGHYPSYHLRLFRKSRGLCEDRLYDQHFVVSGKVGRLQHDYLDVLMSDLNTWTLRHIRWAELEAQEMNDNGAHGTRVRPTLWGNPIERRRWLREVLYRNTPLFSRAFFYWFYCYVVRLGFLDGKEGFTFHFLRILWCRILVDIKLDELRRSSRKEVEGSVE